ncbi:hypothetical protein D7V18_22110 [Stenotrophomonas maltophilia]|nr:hypothetical protein [Stenotrophomonas maltophilia]
MVAAPAVLHSDTMLSESVLFVADGFDEHTSPCLARTGAAAGRASSAAARQIFSKLMGAIRC